MKHRMYVIKDELTGFTPNIMMMANDAEATRALKIAVDDEGSMINKSPEDYSIYYMGTYETETGALMTEQPTKIASARAVKGGK